MTAKPVPEKKSNVKKLPKPTADEAKQLTLSKIAYCGPINKALNQGSVETSKGGAYAICTAEYGALGIGYAVYKIMLWAWNLLPCKDGMMKCLEEMSEALEKLGKIGDWFSDSEESDAGAENENVSLERSESKAK